MIYDSSNVPTDPAVLQELVISQSKTIGELNSKLDKAITELQRLNRLFEKFFDKSSEKLFKDKDEQKKQNAPPPDEAETNLTGTPGGRRGEKGGGGRNPLPADLQRVEQVVDVPEEERTCPECGTPFKCIGEERSESLHFKPMELYVVVLVLVKYIAACDCCGKRSAKAESPIKAVDKGVASNSLVAAIAVQKYVDHLPLARQSKRLFKRCGIDLPESSMCRWMAVGAELCMPLYLLMKKLLFGGVYVQMDATGAPYLDPAVKGKSCKGTLWGYNGDPTVPYVRIYSSKRDVDALADWSRIQIGGIVDGNFTCFSASSGREATRDTLKCSASPPIGAECHRDIRTRSGRDVVRCSRS